MKCRAVLVPLLAGIISGILGFACNSTSLVGVQNRPDGGPPPPPPSGPDANVPSDGPPVASSEPWVFFDSLRLLNRDLYAVRADGTSLKRLTTSPAVEREPTVSPDGTMLAFSSDASGTFQLYVMPLPSGTPRQLTSRVAGAQHPTWSPDGRTLAFESGIAIYTIAADGTKEGFACEGPNSTIADRHPAFTPDGRSLVCDHNSQIYRYDLDTQDWTLVVRQRVNLLEHPTVSSDGTTVVFAVNCAQTEGDPNASTIWLAPLSEVTRPCEGGQAITTPADGDARVPSLSPTGHIAFEHGGTSPSRIGVVGPGAPLKDITSGGDDRNPTWAPASLVLP